MALDLNTILVFKTNIGCVADRQHVVHLLASHPGVHDCSVDIEDVDCVLRVVSTSLGAAQISSLIAGEGFLCEELE